MGDEIDRAEALGLLGVVLHPGCYTIGSEAEGLELIAEGLLDLLRARRRGRTMVLLEHTAGQGTSLGATFEQLASIIAQNERSPPRRRLPRHLSPARVRLRHLFAGRLCGDVHAVRPAGRIRAAEGVSPERLEEAARQPRRSPRAHRRRAASASSRSAASSTTGGFEICRCCSRRRKKKAGSPAQIALDRFDERNLETLRGLIQTQPTQTHLTH